MSLERQGERRGKAFGQAIWRRLSHGFLSIPSEGFIFLFHQVYKRTIRQGKVKHEMLLTLSNRLRRLEEQCGRFLFRSCLHLYVILFCWNEVQPPNRQFDYYSSQTVAAVQLFSCFSTFLQLHVACLNMSNKEANIMCLVGGGKYSICIPSVSLLNGRRVRIYR